MNKRLFFALDILPKDKALIAQWRDCNLDLPFKTVASDNFHITIAFLGGVTALQQACLTHEADKLVQKIYSIADNRLELDYIGLFKKPKVLYLGLKTCPNWLKLLAENIEQEAKSMGLFQEDKPYLPHLSIYRKAHETTTKNSLNIPIKIKSFSLYQSSSTENGVSYCPIKTWQLCL